MFKNLFKKKSKSKEKMSEEEYIQKWAEARESEWVRERFAQIEPLMEQYAQLRTQLEDPMQRDAVLDRLAQDIQRDCISQESFYMARHDTDVAKTAYDLIERSPESRHKDLRHKFQLDHPETLDKRRTRYEQLNDGDVDEATREAIRWEITQEWMHQKGTTFPVPAILALQATYPDGQVLQSVEDRMKQQHLAKLDQVTHGMTEDERIDAYHRNRNNRRKGVQGGLSRD